jgi:hypothetical protein
MNIPESSGLYYFYEQADPSKVYYIGQSVNLKRRLRCHEVKRFLDAERINYTISIETHEKSLLSQKERTEIIEKKPIFNTVHNTLKDHPLRKKYIEYKIQTLEALKKKETASLYLKDIGIIKPNHIETCKYKGDCLIELRTLLKPATKRSPLETDLGTFTGWEDYLKQTGWSKTNANDYINLAENWDIVLKLGMQDTTNAETVKKCMRLCRTLKIIRWYKTQLELGRPEEELTLDQYWLEQEAPRVEGPTKKQLQEEVDQLRESLAQLKAEKERLQTLLSVKDLELIQMQQHLNTQRALAEVA